MGKKTLRVALAALPVAVLAGFAVLVLGPHEPAYQGEPLSVWLERIQWGSQWQSPWRVRGVDFPSDEAAPEVREAIRAMAPEAIPILLKMVGSRGDLREALSQISRNKPRLFAIHVLDPDEAEGLALVAFRTLGPEAGPAIPGLIKMLGSRDDDLRMRAASCLGEIGPAAQSAVPALIATLNLHTTNGLDARIRGTAAQSLGKIGPLASSAIAQLRTAANDPLPLVSYSAEVALIQIKGGSFLPFIRRLEDSSQAANWAEVVTLISGLGTDAEPAIPLLVAALGHTNQSIQESAINGLRQIHRQPEKCIPALIPLLKSTNFSVRYFSLPALEAFGTNARSATPELIRCLGDAESGVRYQATNALRLIDPAMAAKILPPASEPPD